MGVGGATGAGRTTSWGPSFPPKPRAGGSTAASMGAKGAVPESDTGTEGVACESDATAGVVSESDEGTKGAPCEPDKWTLSLVARSCSSPVTSTTSTPASGFEASCECGSASSVGCSSIFRPPIVTLGDERNCCRPSASVRIRIGCAPVVESDAGESRPERRVSSLSTTIRGRSLRLSGSADPSAASRPAVTARSTRAPIESSSRSRPAKPSRLPVSSSSSSARESCPASSTSRKALITRGREKGPPVCLATTASTRSHSSSARGELGIESGMEASEYGPATFRHGSASPS